MAGPVTLCSLGLQFAESYSDYCTSEEHVLRMWHRNGARPRVIKVNDDLAVLAKVTCCWHAALYVRMISVILGKKRGKPLPRIRGKASHDCSNPFSRARAANFRGNRAGPDCVYLESIWQLLRLVKNVGSSYLDAGSIPSCSSAGQAHGTSYWDKLNGTS